MLSLLAAALLSQVFLSDEGGVSTQVKRINCVGSGITCAASGVHGTITVTGGGGDGGGAPTDAQYWTGAAHADLSAEKNLGALGTGLVINTAGVPTIKGTNTCTNQFPRSDSASGTWTCASVADADLASSYSGVGACGANQWASTLNDNAAPTCTQPAFSNISGTATDAQLASSYSGVGTCTNQFARVLNDNAAPTCATVVLATDTSGTLAVTRGGTGLATIAANQVWTGTAADTVVAKTVPSCSNATTSKLLYDNATQTWSCGSDQTGGNFGNFAVTFGTDAVSRHESDQAVVSVAWVTGTSEIFVRPKCYVPVGNNTVENCLAAQIACQVIAVSAGVSFTVQCMSPYTASGSYTISYTGA